MDLSKNPHDQISKPKFGDLDHKVNLEEQWKRYRKEIALVHQVFMMLSKKHLNLSLNKEAQDRMVEELRIGNEDYLRSWAVDHLPGITDRFSKQVIAESVRRFIAFNAGSPEVNSNGKMYWED